MTDIPYTRGLQDLAGGCHAWLERNGSWGWSNAGLVVGLGESLLVDTLFDMPMMRAMLNGMASLTAAAPIRNVFNTHSNGDHWFGNQLLANAEIIATTACAREMHAEGATAPAAVLGLPGPAGDFAGGFQGVRLVRPAADLSHADIRRGADLDVGGVEVRLIELGPAHTAGDAVAYVPSARTLYAGDLLFIGGTPMIWHGPIESWVAACDAMAALDVDYVVPGHGQVTGKAGIAAVRNYLEYIGEQARVLHAQGVPPGEAARRINLSEFASWNDGGRIIQDVLSVYYELDPTFIRWGYREILEQIAALDGRAGAKLGR